ncbi:hypothetical protein QFZ74_005498 [Streptomyces sp. V3I7]|nr:hypothetical protein [Streptomyces sp. V3I7]
MVATPSSAATRRIETAASPSVSATVTAASTIRSSVRAACPDGERLPRTARPPAAARDSTIVPIPGTARTTPSRRSSVSTLVAVAIATPHRLVISRVGGVSGVSGASPQ